MQNAGGIITELVSISQNVAPLAAFITGGQLQHALEVVGSRHLDAAILALADARTATRPEARVNSALNSLVEAYTHLSPSRQSSIIRFFRNNTPFFSSSQMESYQRAAACAILVATCYAYLNESRVNRQRWIERCREELRGWAGLYLDEHAQYDRYLRKIGPAPEEHHQHVHGYFEAVTTLETQLLAI